MSNDDEKENDGNNDIVMTFVISESLPVPVATLTIPEITLQESLELRLLGTAAGKDPGHCAYIALNYDHSFVSRVKGYRITDDNGEDLKTVRTVHPEAVVVRFYE